MASRRTALAEEKLQVKVIEASLVQPGEARESHAYFLSSMDEIVSRVALVEAVAIFEASAARHDPAAIMKEALQKVLVHYYPAAGRTGVSAQGRLMIECTGEGVAFVEADANFTIAQLQELAGPDLTALPNTIALSLLASPFPHVARPPLLTAQVTRFICGGFALGVIAQHCVFDAFACMIFLRAWGEVARGLPLSIPPFLNRGIFKARSPLCVKYPHIEYLELEDLSPSQSFSNNVITRSFHFSLATLAKLKEEALEDGILLKCSTFDVLAALVWRARSEAMDMQVKQKVKLLMVVDARSIFEPPLSKGYMGNGLLLTSAIASVSELKERPLPYVVKLVQKAKALVSLDYMQSQIDYMEREKVQKLPLAGVFIISSWSKLPYHDMDFGWGRPKHVTPTNLMANSICFLIPSEKGRMGMNVILGLPIKAMDRFDKLLHRYLDSSQLFSSSKL